MRVNAGNGESAEDGACCAMPPISPGGETERDVRAFYFSPLTSANAAGTNKTTSARLGSCPHEPPWFVSSRSALVRVPTMPPISPGGETERDVRAFYFS